MSALDIRQIPVLNDNYVYLARDPDSGACAVIDPAVSEPILKAAEDLGWTITHILNTHHHGDHVGGNRDIKAATGCTIIGFGGDRARIPGLDIAVKEGDTVSLGTATAQVFEVPGHTSGHIAYHFAESDALFCGDTLFSVGCGRLFEGTPGQMWTSLSKLRALPDTTRVYCAHEYTTANIAFALSIDPDNGALQTRAATVKSLRSQNQPTVPPLLGEEKAVNPFLRADDPGLATAMGLAGADPTQVFAAIRRAKDTF
ncbi:MAG: hydroxyacylglutathione hydrolase [Rhodospirillaceae bacterium]